jgi:hypothetical protein
LEEFGVSAIVGPLAEKGRNEPRLAAAERRLSERRLSNERKPLMKGIIRAFEPASFLSTAFSFPPIFMPRPIHKMLKIRRAVHAARSSRCQSTGPIPKGIRLLNIYY